LHFPESFSGFVWPARKFPRRESRKRICHQVFSGFPYTDYVFYYRVMTKGQGIRLLRVFHGARDHRTAMIHKRPMKD